MLFSHWLFWMKNWHFSTVVTVYQILNKIFKFPPHLGPFFHISYLFELSSGHPNYPIQKWYISASFQVSRKGFRKLQKAIWLTAINEIFKFPPHLRPFCQISYLFELFSGHQITQFKNDTFGLVSRLLERDFANYRKLYG